MKHLFITLTFIVLSIANVLAKNYDFSAVCSSGQTLYYKITSSVAPYTVMVTYPQYYNYGMYIGDVTYYFNSTYPSGDLTIPETVTYNNNVYSVTGIDTYAFYGCGGLTSVTIPNTVKNIGGGVFVYCRNIKSVNIPDSVTNIKNNMFLYCDSLVSITIPNSVTEIWECAFKECISLAEITIPDSVTSIGYEAFSNCHNLKTINIPNTVQSIGPYTFKGCDSLQYNEFANALYLGNDENKYLLLLKAKSTDITSCEINSNCKYIADYAFDGCTRLTSISIPNSVVYIGYSAFAGSSIAYINIPKSVIYIGEKAINGLTILCEPASRPEGWYYYIYGYNYGVPLVNEWHSNASTVIWDKKATITDEYVFCATDTVLRKCEIYKYIGSASDLIIPSSAYFDGVEYSVTGICDDAFDGYTFHSITLESTTPPNLSNANAFQSYIPINVPCGSLANYQSANTWSELNLKTTLKYSFEFSSADVEKGDVEVLREPTCEKSAIIQATAETGYAFEKWSDGNKSNPRYLTVTQDTALAAYFVVDEVEAEIASANTAQGTVSNSSGTYHYNDEIEISATANYGYHFARWSDGVTTNPRTVVLRKDTVIEAEFAVNQYAITLKTNNAALGSVSGGGTFNYLSNNEISATANDGYVFAKWEDGNTANPRTVSLTRDTTFTAVFVPAECQLQVATSDEVKGSVSNSSGTYHYKDVVEISATANYGYHFTCWSDSVTANPRTVTITRDTVIRAEFALNQYSISLQVNDSERGSVSGAGGFNYLSNNQITATANYGFVFEKWSDGVTTNPRTVALTQDTAFTAVFALDKFTLQVTSSNTVDYKSEVWISATPTAHYHFVSWNDGNRQNPRTVQVLSDTAFVATFAIDSFKITATSLAEEFGSVSGGGLYAYGTAVEVKALPQPHCHFVEWSNGASGLVQTFNVEKDTAIAAVFAIDSHRLQVASADSAKGTVTGSGNYDYGRQITVSATAAAGCYFTGWSDGTTANPRIITIESDTTVVANFEQLMEFNITVVPSDTARGTVSGTGRYLSGTESTLSATPRQHYLFSQWSDGRTDNPRTVRVIADATYTAVFVPEQYNVVLSQNNADMGMVSGSGVYSYGDVVSCLAKPYQNYHFVQWSNGETANPYEFVIEGNQLLTAYFAAGAVTGIEDDAAPQPIIYAVGKTIVVENATDEILVYDAMGKLLCRDAIHRVRTEITINTAGVYIVKTGNAVMRVVVE